MLDLKPYLRMKSKNEMVAIEAARVICELHWLYEKDLSFAVTSKLIDDGLIYSLFFSSPKFPFIKQLRRPFQLYENT